MCDDVFLSKVREKNALYRRQISEGCLTFDQQVYLRQLSSEVTRMRRDLKRRHFQAKLAEAGKNSKAAWAVLHSFLRVPGKSAPPSRTFVQDGKCISGDSDVAEAFGHFFTEIGPRLASKVRCPDGKTFKDFLGPSSRSSLYLSPTTPGEIESICLGLDSSKGPGHDEISPSVIKFVSSELSAPLSNLINVCMQVGHYPDFIKIARITPIFKADDPQDVGNYRPISVLSVFSKIFETVLQERLLRFFNSNGFINNG